jgi:hypothetical protein
MNGKIKWQDTLPNLVSIVLVFTQTSTLTRRFTQIIIAPSTEYANAFGNPYTSAVNTQYTDQ